ncbi:uncharacterized protein [Prorops nasuta]|uniref:uncharacterized protein n=1 Tax=Prorops nasuta TaxID=863751 RepID=UPI0034CE8AF1
MNPMLPHQRVGPRRMLGREGRAPPGSPPKSPTASPPTPFSPYAPFEPTPDIFSPPADSGVEAGGLQPLPPITEELRRKLHQSMREAAKPRSYQRPTAEEWREARTAVREIEKSLGALAPPRRPRHLELVAVDLIAPAAPIAPVASLDPPPPTPSTSFHRPSRRALFPELPPSPRHIPSSLPRHAGPPSSRPPIPPFRPSTPSSPPSPPVLSSARPLPPCLPVPYSFLPPPPSVLPCPSEPPLAALSLPLP